MKKVSEINIIEYIFDSEEERMEYVEKLTAKGYEVTGPPKKHDGSLWEENPDYYWYGRFVKYMRY